MLFRSLGQDEVQVVEGAERFFFNDTATTEIYTLSLHDALSISLRIKAIIIKKISVNLSLIECFIIIFYI